MKIRNGEVGKVLKIFVQDDGAVKDLTGYTATLRVKSFDGRVHADRATTVTAATGLVSYTTVAGDWLANSFDKIGTYTGQLKLTAGSTVIYTATFPLEVVDNFKD